MRVIKAAKQASKPSVLRYANDVINVDESGVYFGDGGVDGAAPTQPFIGGNDTFFASESNQNYVLVGETVSMSGGSKGGNDTFNVADNSFVVAVGDSFAMSGKGTQGGKDTFHGSDAVDADGGDVTAADSISGFAVNIAIGDAGGAWLGSVDPGIDIDAITGGIAGVRGLVPAQADAAPTVESLKALLPGAGAGAGSLAGTDLAAFTSLLPGIAGDGTIATQPGGMSAGAVGGADTLFGGDALRGIAINVLSGDADFMSAATGGRDALHGGDVHGSGIALNGLIGDALLMDDSTGGDDRIRGGDVVAGEYGVGGGGILGFNALALNLMVGDGAVMTDSIGGHDHFHSGHLSGSGLLLNVAMGDAVAMLGTSTGEPGPAAAGSDSDSDSEPAFTSMGGDDVFKGGHIASSDGLGIALNLLVGDAALMTGAGGGDDYIRGGDAGNDDHDDDDDYDHDDDDHDDDHVGDGTTGTGGTDGYSVQINLLSGDGLLMCDAAGGDDKIRGGSAESADGYGSFVLNLMVGDSAVTDNVIAGDDKLIGGDGYAINLMVGDAALAANTDGGDDVLVAGNGLNLMWGDFIESDEAASGEPVLEGSIIPIGGDGYSVGGADTFVFESDYTGTTQIFDFDDAEGDRIDLSDFDLDAVPTESVVATSSASLSGFISGDATETVIDLTSVGGGTITLHDVSSDYVLANLDDIFIV